MQVLRRVLCLIAIAGFATGLAVYFESFNGLTLDKMFGWLFAIHLGVFLVIAPIFVVERSAIRQKTFFWNDFLIGKPYWVFPVIKLLGAIFIIHFVLFLVLSHAASPAIVNGNYVLNDHGHIRKFLTESEYRTLKGHELRIFPTGWMDFYAVAAIYWWFPKSSERDTQEAVA